MNPLRDYFQHNTGNTIDKWDHYFDIYHQWFKEYREKPVVILEIGVFQGGSLQMWREYFGEKAKIFAIDINPSCKQFEGENTKVFIGSQEDRAFLKTVISQIPKIDILIDDGGHHMQQQIVSFEELYPHVKNDGIYLCEDLHTSYWKAYGGGHKANNSFITYSKELIDQLNAWHSREEGLCVDNFTRSAYGMHFYDSILVIEKKPVQAPVSRRKGKMVIPISEFLQSKKPSNADKDRVLHRLKTKLLSLFTKRNTKS